MNVHQNQLYRVVVNHEEQYSLWPQDMENAIGWRDAGWSGAKEECLSYIKKVWTDMRPLSLRKATARPANTLVAENLNTSIFLHARIAEAACLPG